VCESGLVRVIFRTRPATGVIRAHTHIILYYVINILYTTKYETRPSNIVYYYNIFIGEIIL